MSYKLMDIAIALPEENFPKKIAKKLGKIE